MSQTNFRSLQDQHEALLQKQQQLSEENQQDFSKEVREYIEEAKGGGRYISSNRERDQLRANLRYWANYIYGIDKTFPDIELAPSAVESKAFSGTLIAVLIIFGLIILIGARLLIVRGSTSPATTETPFSTPTFLTIEATQTSELISPPETPTPESGGYNVILSSPENGDFIYPTVFFKGTYDNLKPGWAIHVLFIEGGRYLPIKENYVIPESPVSNEWMIESQLAESPDELGKAQSYSVVLVVSTNESTRDFLSNLSEDGIEINSLPQDTVLPFNNTARVLYRNPFEVVRDKRLLFSLHDGTSYDIYASKPDGSDPRNINKTTPDIDEKDPQFSPDGKYIVYVKRNRATDMYAIHVMDSNGENDHEIISTGNYVLENPEWSFDSSYISYARGERQGSTPYWSIYSYYFSSKGDQKVSEEPQAQANRYSAWIPNKNILIFDEAIGDRARFIQVPMDSQNHSVFFDSGQYVSQPNITPLGGGYLLVYTAIGPFPDYLHDIYAAIDLDGQDPFDGEPISLIRSGGEVVDYPQADPDSNILYYARNGAIFKMEYKVENGQMTLIRPANASPRGELVIPAGPTREAIYFDLNLMDTFFEIK